MVNNEKFLNLKQKSLKFALVKIKNIPILLNIVYGFSAIIYAQLIFKLLTFIRFYHLDI